MTAELDVPAEKTVSGPPVPEGTRVAFEISITDEDGREIDVWCESTRYVESISREVILEVDAAVELIEYALAAVGVHAPRDKIKVWMSVAGRGPEEVGPALGHIPFMIERYAESPHKYVRPPQKITPELLRAMMRSHNSIVALEAAGAEREAAKAELHILEVEAGMHEPSEYD